MESHMAGVAKDQRFAASGSHDLDPAGFFSAFVLVQIFESTNMMNLDTICPIRGPTVFTYLSQEPLFEF
jgi:hypothetical protein